MRASDVQWTGIKQETGKRNYCALFVSCMYCSASRRKACKSMQKYDQHGSDVLRYKPVVVVQDLLDVGLAHAPDTDTLTWLCGSRPKYLYLDMASVGKCHVRQVRVRPASRSGGCTPAPRPGSGTASAWRTAGSSRARRGRGRGRPGRPATPAPASRGRGASRWSLLTGQHHHQHLFSATLGIFCLQVQAQAHKLAVGYCGNVNNMSVRGWRHSNTG